MENSKVVEKVLHAIVHGSIHHASDKNYIENKVMTPYSALKSFDKGARSISQPVVLGDRTVFVKISIEEQAPEQGYGKE